VERSQLGRSHQALRKSQKVASIYRAVTQIPRASSRPKARGFSRSRFWDLGNHHPYRDVSPPPCHRDQWHHFLIQPTPQHLNQQLVIPTVAQRSGGTCSCRLVHAKSRSHPTCPLFSRNTIDAACKLNFQYFLRNTLESCFMRSKMGGAHPSRVPHPSSAWWETKLWPLCLVHISLGSLFTKSFPMKPQSRETLADTPLPQPAPHFRV
jgi:hypothetical protein